MAIVAMQHSLKTKLTLMLMSVSLLAVLATVLTISIYLIYDIKTSKQQELSLSAAVAADRNRAAVLFLDKKNARSNLDIYRHNKSILSACVFDKAGAFFASYQSANATSGDGCPKTAAQARTYANAHDGNRMFSIEAIRNGKEILGSVYLLSDTRAVDTHVRKIIQISVTVTSLVLAVTLLLAIYIQRMISVPILKLAALSEKIGRTRDFSIDMKLKRKDELGLLSRAFNAMLEEVRQRDMELSYANETLEHKVLLRTRELEEAKRVAEKANDAKTEFLRNISHEFRTPLHAMISFASYGIKESKDAPDDTHNRYFQIILKSSERLSRLVNDILDVARYEECNQQFNLQKADMRDLLIRSVDSMQALLTEKQIQVEVDIAADVTSLVCDHDRITQVLTNIIGNAIKFSPKNSTLKLRCEDTHISGEHALNVSCSDQGVGIPDYETDIIFEPFKQSSHTNDGAGGTGLGLSICRGIIHAHNGFIHAANNEGAGALITFTVPTNLTEGVRKTQMTSTEDSHEYAA